MTTETLAGFRLSPQQKYLWKLQENNFNYLAKCTIKIQGKLKPQILKSAIEKILDRHEIFRTIFQRRPGIKMPIQVILDRANISWSHINLANLKSDKQTEEIEEILQQQNSLIARLDKQPIFPASLLTLAPEQHFLLISLPALLVDSWALKNLVQEVAKSYDLCLQESDFDEEVVQYLQFSEWQNELLAEEEAEAEIAYWQDRQFHRVNLPWEKSALPEEIFTPKQYSIKFEADVIAKLVANILPNVTIDKFLLGCWQTLLWRLTKQSDITVKTVFPGREYEELQEVIGLLAKSLPISCHFEKNLTLIKLLDEISDRLTEATERQEYFISSETEAYGIGFEFIDISESYDGGGLSFSLESQSVIFDDFKVKLNCIKTEASLVAEFQYNSELINIDVIKSLAKQFATLVTSAIENIDAPVSQLNILSDSESQYLLDELNQTEKNYPQDKLIHQLFEEQAAQNPQNIALVFAEQKLTYAELNSQANQLAHYLQKMGVKPETIVGIYMERSPLIIIALLAIVKAGGAYLPIDTKLPEQNLAFRLEDAGVSILLSQPQISPKNLDPNIKIITINDENIAQQPHTNPRSNLSSENLAYILYTSGSTGKPKGVAIEHRQILNYLYAIQEKLQPCTIATYAIVSTFAADLGNTVIFPALCSGGCLHVISQECASDATALANYFQRHPIDYLKIVPSHLSTLLTSNPSPHLLPRQYLIVGGEAATWDLIAKIQQYLPQCRILNHYGPTETTVGVLTYPVENGNSYNSKTVPIGRPLANTQVYILDEQMQPVPVGVPGELYIGGAGLARGYLNRPELTAEKFIPLPSPLLRGRRENIPPLTRGVRGDSFSLYKTGDLARYLPDGNIEFLGRIDNQIKIRGFRIELGEIEAAINQHPEIQTALVIVREDNYQNKNLVAYFVPQKKQFAPNNLRQFLQEKLADYAIPSVLIKLDFLPLTPNGKIDRKALPNPDNIRPELENNFVAPRTPTEEILTNIWSELLRVEKVGIHDDFFSLGGHSLLATQVISRIRTAFNTEIPLKYLFDFPTVAKLSKSIDNFHGKKLQLPPIEANARDLEIPLSFAQQRLWFLDRLEAETTVYHNHAGLQLTGKLNVSALETAIKEILRRHEILRTTFPTKNGNAVQVIHPPSSFNLPIIDLQSLPETAKSTEVIRIITAEKARLFDLANGPLLRVSLLQLAAESHILLVVMHHIITDGWSTGIFIRELSILYQSFSTGKASTLPELPVQYADFACWQRRWLSGELLEANLDYWKQQLAGAPPLLELPTDRPRPAIQTFRGSLESFRVNSTVAEKLKTLSQQSGATLFMTLLSAFTILLSRYSNQDDIVVGSPIANRDRSEIEPLIGFFVNTLVLRTQLQGNPSFLELLNQVRQVTLDAYGRQDVPFEQLVEALQPERSLSYSPLFQVMFILQNAPMEKLELPGLSLTPLTGENVTAKFDLTLSMRETEGELEANLEYNVDLFDRSTIIRLTKHFQTLLVAVVANPEQPISEFSLLTEAEKHQILSQWNDTPAEYPQDKCIHQLFERQVAQTPDAVALVFEQQQLTYQHLNQKANQLAHYLQTLGVGADVLVGICLERSVEMVIGLLAILKAGGAYVPIDPNYPPERISFMLSDSQASVLLTQQHLAASLPNIQAQVLSIDNEETFSHQSAENIVSNIDTENLAYVIYTSGSTGKPKGVQIPHRALVNFLTSMQQQPSITRDDVLLAVTTISFDIAGLEIYLPLITGARVILASREVATDGKQLAELISVSGTTMMQATPATWRLLLAAGWQGSENFKILCGGEALPTDLAAELLTISNSVWNMYGPTETTIWSTVCQVEASQLERTSIPIGRPIANTQIYILDSYGQPVPMGVGGELHIGGSGLARGYLNRPELTAEKFITIQNQNLLPSVYKTGDLARYLPDGTIEYLGRIDNQVKIRGFRIELGEIEAVLNQHPTVQQTVVVAQEYNPGDKRLVAYMVCHSQPPTTDELRYFAKEKLPDYMMPSAFVMLESFPLTPNGKINRRALKPPTDFGSSEKSFVPPSTPVEKQLAAIWSEVLGIEKIGIHDNFFDIGGHSLLIVQVQNRLKEISNSNLTVIDLFKNPTISTLAKIVQLTPATQTVESQSIQPVSRQLKLPLSFSQQRLWFIDQLEKTAAYNMLLSARLHGLLNLDALERAFAEIIRRHEVLRTSFQVVDGEPVQIISDNANFSLSIIDWREMPQPEQEKQVRELVISAAGQSFDLSQNPLLRVTPIQLTDKEYVLVFVIHHIISDEWSLGIMIRELVTLYDAFSRGMSSPLPELSIQYADFAYWQRQYLQGELFAKQLAYWQQQLAGVPPVLALPTDRPRPQVQSFRGATTIFELPSELSDNIKKVSQSEGVTLFMFFLTGFQTLLYCYSQQQDFCIGSPIANRNLRETEGIIGFFVNTLVLRANSSGNPSFRELLQRVRETAIGAFANQDLPLEKLLEELKIERSLSHNPLFQVWFMFNNVPISELEMPGLSLTPLEFDNGFVRHDLRLGLWETATGFSGSFQYKTDLFDAETINSMVKDLEIIFTRIVMDVNMRLSEMSEIIQASQKQKQILQQQELENNNRQKLKKMKRKSVL